MRGRIISYFIMTMSGMLPLGSLIIGSVSQYIGAQNSLFCEGIIALIIISFFAKFLVRDKLNIIKRTNHKKCNKILNK